MGFRPAFFLLTAFSAAIFGPLSRPVAAAQDQTEVKIRLMADALTARDRGDYATAKSKLEALQTIAPGDPNVRRLLTDINVRLTAPPAPPVAPPSAPVRRQAPLPPVNPVAVAPAPVVAPVERAAAPAAPGQVVMPVVHDERSDAPDPGPKEQRSPEAVAAATAAEALLHADDTQLGKVMAYVEAQRALARTQAAEKNYPAAIATLGAALEELQRPTDELRSERRDYALQQRADERAEERSRIGVRLRHRR